MNNPFKNRQDVLVLLLAFFSVISMTLSIPGPAEAQPSGDEAVNAAYQSAVESHQPAENTTYFYLRAAGLVWILVEWIAAVILIRVYFLIRRHFPLNPADTSSQTDPTDDTA